MSRRLMVWFSNNGSVIPKVFTDWYDLADYIKQENLAGRTVTINKWEYV